MSKIEQTDPMYSVEKQGGVNDGSQIRQSDATLGCDDAKTPNEQMMERKAEKSSESGANKVDKKNETKDGTGFIEKAGCIARLWEDVKEFFSCLKNDGLLSLLFLIRKKHKEKKKRLVKDVLKETNATSENITSVKDDVRKINDVADQVKNEVKNVSDQADALLEEHKKLYNDAVEKNKELRKNIQTQIEKLETNEKSRKDARDGLIGELDVFISSTKEECRAILTDIEEIDTLLEQVRECKEDEKESHLKQIQEKQAHVLEKFGKLQRNQFEFLETFKNKLIKTCVSIIQQNENLIQELRKIAESTEDSDDKILEKVKNECLIAEQEYKQVQGNHDSWIPAIGWTRPTDEDVKIAKQKFLRAQAKLNILNNIGSDDIKSGLQNLLNDLDEIKNSQENALKNLDDAQGHIDATAKLVDKAHGLKRIFSFSSVLNITPTKVGVGGAIVGGACGLVAGVNALPLIFMAAGCGAVGYAIGKAGEYVF